MQADNYTKMLEEKHCFESNVKQLDACESIMDANAIFFKSTRRNS